MLFDTITYVSGADHLYDIAGSTLSTPSDLDVIVRFEAVRAFKIPASFAGTSFGVSSGSEPDSLATLTVKKNGSALSNGTITMNSGGTVVLGSVAETSFAVGDLLEIELTTADNIDNLGITLKTLAA